MAEIKLELLKGCITDLINLKIGDIGIDPDEIAETTAIKALREIQGVIANDDLSDFDAVEEIVCIFEKYRLDFGFRHDFG
ncbi:MAG: hypothetical protein IJT38_05840 [Clostridia bacterium]|nr:hypothetical protein [Clostridia bacterium]